jgi:hypothetical protein
MQKIERNANQQMRLATLHPQERMHYGVLGQIMHQGCRSCAQQDAHQQNRKRA